MTNSRRTNMTAIRSKPGVRELTFVQVSSSKLVKLLYYAGRRIASPPLNKPGQKWLVPNKWSEKGNLEGTRDHCGSYFETRYASLESQQSGNYRGNPGG